MTGALAPVLLVAGLALRVRRIRRARDIANATPYTGSIDAVIPAFNEAATVGDVARVLIASGLFGRVIVVDDGSIDGTANEARAAGAEVIAQHENAGKMDAMLAGAQASDAPALCFVDADAVNLDASHLALLVDRYRSGAFVQVCGIQEHGILNPLHRELLPLATGQRIVSRAVLEKVPATCRGYTAEVAINFAADRMGRTDVLTLTGLRFRTKQSKLGMGAGWAADARMLWTMRKARRHLVATDGESCDLEDRT